MTDTEQLLSDSIDKISELSIENHRLKAQIEELIKENEEMKSGLGCETCQIHLEFMNLNKQIAELKKIEEEYYDFIQKKNEEDWKGDNVVGCLKLKIEQLKAQNTITQCNRSALSGVKWHKVADGDLPNNTDNVLSDKGTIVYYNFTYDCWVDERTSVKIDDVIAWCEIPKFNVVVL